MFSLLYIDDEPGLLELGKLFLESTGDFDVTVAISGNEGLGQLAQHDFDAIVSDFQMPGMDGIELLKKVRKSFGSIPFILFTGRGREEVVIEAINNGVDFYLQKGGDPKAQFAELAHKVRQAVNRRSAEIALSDSEQRLADIINFLPDATFAIDTKGFVIAWNRAMERMTGSRAEDVLGKGDYEYALPFYHERRPLLIDLVLHDDPAIAEKYPLLKREGKNLFSEITIPHFNNGRGAALWFTASPLYNRNGDVVGAIESIRDITERKRAEEALNESERRFRELADLLPQGIYEARTDGRMIYANRIALEMSGYTAEDVENGLNALDVIAPEDRQRARSIFARLVETGSRDQGSAEYLGVRKDGSKLPVSIYSSPIYRDGRITGIRGVIIDITDRKKAEEKLVSANLEYTNLLEQIQDVYYRTDAEGRLVGASRSWAVLFGYDDISECLGKSIAEDFYLNPADRKPLLDAIYRDGKVTEYEVTLKKKDGTTVLVAASSHLYYDSEGNIAGVEGTFRDITDRKKAEDELRAAYEQLTASEEELKEQYNELSASEQRTRESEQKYRTVFETTGTAMLMIEDDAMISLVNSEFARMSGFSREEIENKKKWMEFVVPEDRERMLAHHRQRRIDPDSSLKKYEFRFVTRSGESRIILLSIDMIPGTTKSIASLLDITERRRAADELQAANEQLVATGEELRAQYEELAQSEKQLRLLKISADRSSDQVFWLDFTGNILYVNDAACRDYGYSREEFSRMKIFDLNPDVSMEIWKLSVDDLREKKNQFITSRHQRRDGSFLDVEIVAVYVNQDNREYSFAYVRDITDRKKAEDELKTAYEQITAAEEELREQYNELAQSEEKVREGEEKYHTLIELSPFAVIVHRGGKIVFVNPEAVRLAGAGSSDQILGRDVISFVHPDDHPAAIEDFRMLEEEGRIIPLKEERLVRLNGEPFTVEITAMPIHYEDKPAVLVVFHDITERKRIQAALRGQEKLLDDTFSSIRDGISILDTSMTVIRVNRTMEEWYSHELPLVGRKCWEVYHGRPGRCEVCPSYRTLQTRQPSRDTVPMIDAGQMVGWLDLYSFPLIDSDTGEMTGVIEYVRNITAEKQAQDELRAAYEKLSASEEELREQYDTLAALQEDLRQHQQQLEEIAGTIPGVVYQFYARPDGTWGLYYVSSRTEEVFGIPSTTDDFFTRFTGCVDPRDREAFLRSIADVTRAGLPWKFEGRFIKPTGESIWFEGISRPIWRADEFVYNGVLLDISDRKKAEEAIAESERKYRTVFETAEEGIWIVDTGFRTVSANRKMQELFGYTEKEMAGRPVWDFVPLDETESMKQELSKRPRGVPGRYERRWIRKDGTIIWCLTSATPLFSPGGEFLGSFGMFTDTTERKQVEDALRESEAKLRAVIDQSFQMIGLMTPDGILIDVNRAALDLVGTSGTESLNRPFWETPWWSHSSDLQEKLKDAIRRAASGETVRFEATHLAADGHLASIDFSIKPVVDSEGRIRYLIPEGRDITERKQVEDELMRLKISTDRSSDEIFWMDFGGNILYANDAACQITGYSRDEFLKMKIFQLDPDFPPGVWDASVADLRERKTQFITTRHRRKDGSTMDVEIVAVYVNQDEREYSFAYVRDITERKRMEAALRENEEKYRTLVESSFDGIAIHQNGILVYVNRTAARLLGSENPDEFVGRNAIDIVAPAFRDLIAERVNQAPEQSMELIHEQFLRLDGTAIDVNVTTTPTTWQGRPAAYVTFRDITAQVQAETALRESEEKYRMLVEQSRDGIFIIQDGRLVFYNKALTGLSGYTAEELDGRFLAELVAPEDREIVVSRAQDRARGNDLPARYEFSLLHKDNNRRIRVRVSAGLGSYKGRPASIGTFYDVTEDRKREEALRESEEKFRALVETTSDFIWEVDADGRYTYVSPQVRHILGYEPEELMGKTPFDLMPPDEYERVTAEFNRSVASRLPISGLENKALRKDGSVVLLETSGVVRTAEDGSYRGYRGIDRDITVRKQAEEALREKTEELNRFFTASLDLFCIADTDGFFRRLNPEWEKTLGYTLKELEGQRFLDFVHPDDLEPTLAAIADLGQQKTVLNFTNRFRHKDGTYRWVEWRSLPLGNLIFAAARDITERYVAAERTERISALKQELLKTAPLKEKLKRITDAIVNIFGADFARIWITRPGDLCNNGCIHAEATDGAHACRHRTNCLHLVVSSGRYTHTDGGHRRVPFGAYKIGRIASGDETVFITNDVTHDPRVHDHAWAESLGLVSFAGFRLVSSEGKPIGVLAFFSRQPVMQEVLENFDDLATTTSQVVQTDMAEQAHRESEAQLSSILHGSPVLQFVIDRHHRVISWNKALEEYSGISAAEMIGTDQQWRAFYVKKRPVLADLLIDGDTDTISRMYEGKSRKSRYVEGAYEATDFFPQMGSSGKWLSFTAAPVRDVRGSIIGAVETLEDVTERIEAENTIRESEEWARTILNTAQAGIILVDADTHKILDANKKALELIGLDTGAVVGQVCHRFICPVEKGRCPVTDLYQKVDTAERVLLTAAGDTIPVLKTVIPVTIRSRSILVESFVDITEQKRSETAIREANRKLNLLNSITRHDIRNQVMVAQGFTQLAALSKPDTTVMDFLTKITAAIETIQRQIEFTKEYQELGVHAPAWFRVDDVVSSVRPEKIAFENSCRSVEIYADPMIDKVFFNLFDNAVKHGERVTEVTVGCEEIDDFLVLTFADNGCGIPPAEKKKIFDKGFGRNTGLGLFLAREILAITGITIHENGTYGEGAVFEIIIPKGMYRKVP